MRKLFILTGRIITKVIDFFYPAFKKYFSLQFFRYGVSGALNLLFSFVSFFVIYQYVIQKRMLDLGFVHMGGHTAAVIINFALTTFTGFLLQKYVTFTASDLKGRKQLVRYVQVATVNLLINYLGMKFLFEVIGIFPSISNAIIAVFTTILSYFLQKRYTFRIKNIQEE
ncbi:MAG: GtrA family protein [Paludibacteraceae bacterium]